MVITFRAGPYLYGMAFGGSHKAYIARCKLGGYKGGPKRAAYWRTLGFPNLALAREARWGKPGTRRLEEWKRKELERTPYALLDDPPPELRPQRKKPHSPTTQSQFQTRRF